MVKAIILPIGKKVVDKSIKKIQKKIKQSRAYYLKNKDKWKKAEKKYREKYPEKTKLQRKKYRDANREKYNALFREYYKKVKDTPEYKIKKKLARIRDRKKARKRYLKNKDEIQRRAKEWRKNNPKRDKEIRQKWVSKNREKIEMNI